LGRAAAASAAPLAWLAGLIAYQRVLVPRLIAGERHPMSLSLAHGVQVFLSGAECTVFNRLTHKIAKAAAYAAGHFGPGGWLWWAAGVAAAAWACARLSGNGSRPPRRLAWLGLGFFVLGYAPYVLDATYSPEIFNAVNRVNLVGSLGGAAWLAWACARVASAARPARWLAPVLIAAFLLADMASNAQWADASRLQEEILTALDAPLRRAPRARFLLLYGTPGTIGSAVVFDSTYDLDGALAMRGADAPHGFRAEGSVRFEPAGALRTVSPPLRIPYDGLYAYRHSDRAFARIDGPAAGAAFLAAAPRP
jgi:hypothetical protein